MQDSFYRCFPIELRGLRSGTSILKLHAFCSRLCRREGLTAENIEQFLDRVVEYSDGNPGAMLQMIRMAKAPKYSHENQIKITPLYIDYRIAMVSQ